MFDAISVSTAKISSTCDRIAPPRDGSHFEHRSVGRDSDFISRLLNGAFENVGDAELFGDFRDVVGCVLETLR